MFEIEYKTKLPMFEITPDSFSSLYPQRDMK